MADMPGDSDLTRPLTDRDLGLLQFSTVLYYLHETNPDNGLVRDKTDPSAPVSIAAVGMALATIPVVVERGVLFREFAAKITRKRLRYLLQCPQGPEPDASGYKGFFYHFLDIETGRRAWQCELSTIDSAFLFAGALTVATYFDRDTPDEAEIRNLGQCALPARRLELGSRWRSHTDAWMAAGERIYPAPLARLRRRFAAIHPRARFADISVAARELSRLLRNLSVEEDLRSRIALLGPAVYASTLAHVDRLSRHSRRVHARARQRLLRKQPAGDLRAAGIRDPQSDEFRRLRRTLLGIHGLRRTRLGQASGQRRRTRVLRLCRSRRSIRSRRRHRRPVGGRRLAAVRSGDRHSDCPPFCAKWTWA